MAFQLTPRNATQDWLHVNCNDFIAKDEWPPNSPDLNPLDNHVRGAMLEAYHKLDNKPPTVEELQTRLQKIWNDLPHKPVARAVQNFRKQLYIQAGKYFEHLMWLILW